MADRDWWWRWLWDAADWDLVLAETVLDYVLTSLRNGWIIFGRETGVEVSLDVQNPHVGEWLRQYTGLMANRVNETAREGIREALLTSLEAGESPQEMRDRVLEAFGCRRDETGRAQADEKLRYRAEMIARTESARASTAGYRMQAKEAGFARVVWMAAPDCCEFCAEMDGRAVDIDKPFYAKGDTLTIADEDSAEHSMHLNYADVDGPPLHPWCRCVLGVE